jgi:hypothetical protein
MFLKKGKVPQLWKAAAVLVKASCVKTSPTVPGRQAHMHMSMLR